MNSAVNKWFSRRRPRGHRGARILAVAALVATFAIPATPHSTASERCDPDHPLADLELFHEATSPSEGVVSYLLRAQNLGPCNADGLVFTDTLPSGVTLEAIRTNPGSMSCSQHASESGSIVRCELTANIGVPGGAWVELIASAPTGATFTNFAHVSLSGDTSDPDDNNNSSYGALIGDEGGTLDTGALVRGDESNQVVLPTGVSGTVTLSRGDLDEPCPLAFPGCSGRPVDIKSPSSSSAPIRLIFNKDATLIEDRRSQLFIIYLPDGSQEWLPVPKCKKQRSYPCLSSVERLNDPALVSPSNPKGLFYRLTVLTLHTSRWR